MPSIWQGGPHAVVAPWPLGETLAAGGWGGRDYGDEDDEAAEAEAAAEVARASRAAAQRAGNPWGIGGIDPADHGGLLRGATSTTR